MKYVLAFGYLFSLGAITAISILADELLGQYRQNIQIMGIITICVLGVSGLIALNAIYEKKRIPERVKKPYSGGMPEY